MCRAKSDPNYYRCDWGEQSTSALWIDSVIQAGSDTSVSVVANMLDGQPPDALDELRTAAMSGVRDVLAERSPDDLGAAAKALRQRRGHMLCGLFAAVGEACSAFSQIPDDIGKGVNEMVTDTTGSKLVGALANSIATKLLEFASTGLEPVSQIGSLADMLAVDTCPAQPAKPRAHPETEEAARRLERAVVGEALSAMTEASNV
jgi:hypothetical protein